MTEKIFEDQTLNKIFFESLHRDGAKFFCNRNIKFIQNTHNEYEHCKVCKITCCITCLSNCHLNCKGIDFKSKHKDLNIVKLYYSACECKHLSLENDFNEPIKEFTCKLTSHLKKLNCYLSKNLIELLNCKKNISKFYKNLNTKEIHCYFCHNYCKEEGEQEDKNHLLNWAKIEEKDIDDEMNCSCNFNQSHLFFSQKFEFLREILNKDDAEKENDFHYSDLMNKISEILDKFFNQIKSLEENENEILDKYLEKEKTDFSIILIMFKRNLIRTYNDEYALMEKVREKVINFEENEIYFTLNNENLLLTYTLYFYKKFLISKLHSVDNNILNLMDRHSRIDYFLSNVKIKKEIIAKNQNFKFFELSDMKYLLFSISQITFFSVKTNEDKTMEHHTPFLAYFINLLMRTYSNEFERHELSFFFKIKQHPTYSNSSYNFQLRRLVDECYYISQIQSIDFYLNQETQIDLKSKETISKIKFKNFMFFFESSFNDYMETKFVGNKHHLNRHEKKQLEKVKIKIQENSIFLDTFNNSYFEQIIFPCFKTIKPAFSRLVSKVNEAMHCFYNKEDCLEKEKDDRAKDLIGYFDIFTIPYHSYAKSNSLNEKNKVQQNSALLLNRYIKRILRAVGLDLKEFEEVMYFENEEFLDLAFKSLKKMNKDKKDILLLNIPSNNDDYKKIELDFNKINMKIFHEELLYIFYNIFILEFHKSSQFQLVIFNWNLLMLVFIGSLENIKFLLCDIKFLDFMLHSKVEKKIKKSFLIRALYNTNRNMREKNYIWKYFFYIFKNFIKKERDLKYLQINIQINFIDEIFNFYQIKNKKKQDLKKFLGNISEDKSLITTMNYQFICSALKIIKSQIIDDNPKEYLPFNYNVNKHETFENINLIADIIFHEKFDFEGYKDTYVFKEFNMEQENINQNDNFESFDDTKKRFNFVRNSTISLDNLDKLIEESLKSSLDKESTEINRLIDLHSNNIAEKYNDENNKKEKTFFAIKKLNHFNLQFLIIEILGFSVTTPNIKTYFNIINKNFIEFKEILKNRNEIHSKYFKKILYKLEKAIIKLLLNFLTIKVYEYDFINVFIRTDLQTNEIQEISRMEKDSLFKSDIDQVEICITSRYFLTAMKVKIIELLEDYFENFNINIYDDEEENELLKIIFVSLYWINKYFSEIKNYILCEKYLKMFKKYILNTKLHPNEEKEINDEYVHKSFNYENNQIYFNLISERMKQIKFTYNEEKDPYILSFLDFKKSILPYLIKFGKFENKINSLPNQMITDLLNKFSEHDHGCNNDKGKHCHFDYVEQIKLFNQKFWEQISSDICEKNDPNRLKLLLNYLFKKLNELGELENLDYNRFNEIFNENFLKILFFLNNILYQEKETLQKILIQNLTSTQMRLLMINTLKINYYIIGIAEYENNDRLFSISVIYFILMEFFVCLIEERNEGGIIEFFFESLNDKEEKKIEDEKLKLKEISKMINEEENNIFRDININEHNKFKELEIINKLRKIIFKDNENISKETNISEKILEKDGDIECIKNNHSHLVIQESLNQFDNFYTLIFSIENSDKFLKGKNDNDVDLNDSTTCMDILYSFTANLQEDKKNQQKLTDEEMKENKIKNIKKCLKDFIPDYRILNSFNIEPEFDEDNIFKINIFGAIVLKLRFYGNLFNILNKVLMKLKIYTDIFDLKVDIDDVKSKNKIYNSENKGIIFNKFLEIMKTNNQNFEDINSDLIFIDEFETKKEIFDLTKDIFEKSKVLNDNYKIFFEKFLDLISLKNYEEDNSTITKEDKNEFLFIINLELIDLKSSLKDILQIFGISDQQDEEVKSFESKIKNSDIFIGNKYFLEFEIKHHDTPIKELSPIPDDQNNFFYQNFMQMKSILLNITKFSINNFSSGSERLILQFVYSTRILKEFSEKNFKELDNKVINIVRNCYIEIFNPIWLFPEFYGDNKYKNILLSSILKLIISFLENNNLLNDSKFLQFKENFDNFCSEDDRVYYGMIQYFKAFYKEKFTSDFIKNDLFLEYTQNEDFYMSEEFELAQLYHKLFKLLDKSFMKVLEQYDPIHQSSKIEPFNKKTCYTEKEDDKKPLIREETKQKKQKDKEDEKREFFKFYRKIQKEIEVGFNFCDNSKEEAIKIHFFATPKCLSLIKSIKIDFENVCPRDSQGAKIDFLNRSFDRFLLAIELCYINRILKRRFVKFFLELFSKYSLNKIYYNFTPFKINLINFLLNSQLNILLLIHFYRDNSSLTDGDLDSQMFISSRSDTLHLLTNKYNTIFFMTIPTIMVQLILLAIWIFFRFNTTFWLIKYDMDKNNFYKIKNNIKQRELDKKQFEEIEKFNEIETQKKFNIFGNIHEKIINFDKKVFVDFWCLFKTLFMNDDVFFISWGIILNIIYLIFNYHFLVIVQIMSIINFSLLFRSFFDVIANKFTQFFTLLLFVWWIEYIISWFTFFNFQEFMISDHALRNTPISASTTPEMLCSTAIECFLNHLHLGLRSGGGMGDTNPRVSFKFNDPEYYLKKVSWDTFIHIVVNLILANIFFGVIVDSFNDLRDKSTKVNNDKINKCFICNLDRFDIQNGKNFDKHRKIEHNTYDYVYLIHYLNKKNPQEYSPVESYVWNQINLRRIDWFPSAKFYETE